MHIESEDSDRFVNDMQHLNSCSILTISKLKVIKMVYSKVLVTSTVWNVKNGQLT